MVTLASKPRLCAAPEQVPSVPVRDQLLPAASHAFCAASPFAPNSKPPPPMGAPAGFLAVSVDVSPELSLLATAGFSLTSSWHSTSNPPALGPDDARSSEQMNI